MTVTVTYQRFMTPLVQDGVMITQQRLFVPFVGARGISVSQARLFVPLIEPTSAVTRRRNFMSFQT